MRPESHGSRIATAGTRRSSASGSVMRMHANRARESLLKGTPVRGCTLMRLRVRTRVLLFVGALMIGLTGHFGGILVHGQDFFDW